MNIRVIPIEVREKAERHIMGKTYQSGKQQVWALLSEAGLGDIPTDEFPQRVKEAKKAVMDRLGELLESTTDVKERDSAACSLATLKKLETALQRRGSPHTADCVDDSKF
jgi:hypothetical protein